MSSKKPKRPRFTTSSSQVVNDVGDVLVTIITKPRTGRWRK